MNFITVLIILIVLLIYLGIVIVYIKNASSKKGIQSLIEIEQDKSMRVLGFESSFLKKIGVQPEKVRILIYIERVLLILSIGTAFYFLRGVGLALFGAALVIVMSSDAYRRVIYESGITNIPRVANFINHFEPHVISGKSADQAFLNYISTVDDTELATYYENRDNPEYSIPPHLAQIVEIYRIAKYNEEIGHSDYTYIIQDISNDMSKKEGFYNSFVSRIGEILPTTYAYYIGVPILVFVSIGQARDFWMGIGGYIVSLILLIMFATFKFLIFKLQEKTINTIF